MTDSFHLDRFTDAQAGCYEIALRELRQGRKRSHWMWYIFPQLRGLGQSETARYYGIASLDEARAYLAHPVLGQRLGHCIIALQDLPPMTAQDALGSVDAIKLRSSLTLFLVAGAGPIFEDALHRWFDGQRDDVTLARLMDQP